MYIPFQEMKDTSRVWVYQCNRFLTAEEAEWLSNSLSVFLDGWKAHGQPLLSSFELRENLFLILAVDEEAYGASGCSIDASVHELKALQGSLGVDFFTREAVVFKKEGDLDVVKLVELKQKAANGEVQADWPVFNTLVASKGSLKTDWLVPAGNTWLKRYFKTADTFQ